MMEEMEGIVHRRVEVNGIKMHVAEKGEKNDPVVLFLHGFPELWYSWRHQIAALSSLGYRTVAPDLRGFGDTDVPASVGSYSILHLVADIVQLIESLGVDQVFLVGHDWGSIIGWHICLFRPDKIKAFVSLTVPFMPRNPKLNPVDAIRDLYGDDYFLCRFQIPGKTEAEYGKYSVEQLLKNIFSIRNPGPPSLPKTPSSLPPWISQQELTYYASKFAKTGFTGGLNYYRNINLNWELTTAWTGVQVKVPAKFITGELDMVYNSLGVKDYIESGAFKKDVPNLDSVIVQEGVAHFNTQETAEEITNHIYDFINKF